jgi:hypothetical protein
VGGRNMREQRMPWAGARRPVWLALSWLALSWLALSWLAI